MLPSNVYMKIFDELRNGALGESLGRSRGIFGQNHQKRTKNSKTCRRIKREHHEIDHSIEKNMKKSNVWGARFFWTETHLKTLRYNLIHHANIWWLV